MPMLHTVNKSPFERNSLVTCINHTTPKSAILMIEDGVYGAMQRTVVAEKITTAGETISFYVLEPDLAARGMNEDKLIDGVKAIDYKGFVDLVTEFDKVQAWL